MVSWDRKKSIYHLLRRFHHPDHWDINPASFEARYNDTLANFDVCQLPLKDALIDNFLWNTCFKFGEHWIIWYIMYVYMNSIKTTSQRFSEIKYVCVIIFWPHDLYVASPFTQASWIWPWILSSHKCPRRPALPKRISFRNWMYFLILIMIPNPWSLLPGRNDILCN